MKKELPAKFWIIPNDNPDVNDVKVAFNQLIDFLTPEKEEEEKWIPKHGETYYIPDISVPKIWNMDTWHSDGNDNYRMSNGLLFRTKKEAIEKAKEILAMIKK